MSRWLSALLPVVTIVVPLGLILSAMGTLRELEAQRDVYLRSRVAAIAARLETIPPGADPSESIEDEPGVVQLTVLEHPAAGLEPLWQGRELFRTGEVEIGGRRIFRAWVPFHSAAGLRVARIDVARSSADFLLAHPRRNVVFALAGSLVLILLALATAWSVRRAARVERLAEIGKMSAVLAHEIRNPLGTIKGFAQLLGEHAGAAERELLKPILAESTRLEALVQALLLYGRPPEPVFAPVAWPDIVEALKPYAKFKADAPAIRFSTDANLLRQALLNLLRNAGEAAPDSVRLAAERDGRSVLITVEDHGPGMTEEARRRLFEPFFTTKATGTGLGLAITRRLVESLGGRLELASRNGGGTAARIHLPA